MKTTKKTKQNEELLVRLAVRRAIAEGIDDAKSAKKNTMMTDVGGDDLKRVAADLGFSVSGAKQAIDKAMKKAQFLAKMDDADRELLVLTAIKDYMSELEDAIDPNDPEAPTSDDIQLMYDNPEIVATLDGFREYLHKYVKRAAKMSGEKIS